jgi:hypothetical protein
MVLLVYEVVFVSDPVKVVEVTEGETARLPCNITPTIQGDRVKLVLWFKNESLKPFFT